MSENSNEDPLQVIPSAGAEPSWESRIRSRFKDQCAGCGGDDHLHVKMLVPVEAGGAFTETNGVLICRSCELASDAVSRRSGFESRLVNFWVSQSLFSRLQKALESETGPNSMGALVRLLMVKYIEAPEAYSDVSLYQDTACDTKINVWVSQDQYAVFKDQVNRHGLSVTEALRALLSMWFDVVDEISAREAE